MRPVTVSAGPVGSTAANNIAASQTTPGPGSLIATTITAGTTAIAATNTFAAGYGVVFSGPMQSITGLNLGQVYYVIASGLSGSQFEVSDKPAGTAITPGGTGTATPNVATAGQVTLNGSLASYSNGVTTVPLSSPQRIKITTADTTHTFTVNGLDAAGNILTETIGPITSSATSTLDYSTITSITVSGTLTAAVTVGNGGSPLASTPWVRLDEWSPGTVSIQVDVTGTVNFTVQCSNDDPNSPTSPVLPQNMDWINTNDPAAVSATASLQTNFLIVPTWTRTLLNSGSGSIVVNVVQSGVVPY